MNKRLLATIVAAILLATGLVQVAALAPTATAAPPAEPPLAQAPGPSRTAAEVPAPGPNSGPADEVQGDIGTGWIRDREASWDRYSFFTGLDAEGDYFPDFATGPNGYIYAVYEEYDDENADFNIALTYSPDGGVTWIGTGFLFFSSPFYPRATLDRQERHPSIAVDPFGSTVWIAYESWEAPGFIADINITHASTADLTTWTEVTQAYDGACPLFCFWGERPDFALENHVSGPYYYVAFEIHSIFGIYASVFGTRDVGATWVDIYDAPAAPTGSEQRLPQITIGYMAGDVCDKRGYLSYVFGYTASVYEVRFEVATGVCGFLVNTADGPWGAGPTVLYNGTTDNIFPSLPTMANVYGNGTVVVAWDYDRTPVAGGNGFDIGYAYSLDYGVTWSPEQTDLAAAGADERAPRLAFDGEGDLGDTLGSVHLAYQRGPGLNGGDVLYAVAPWDAPVLGAAAPVEVANNAPPAAAPSLSYLGSAITTQLRPDGLWYPVIGWTDFRDATDYDIYATTPGGNLTIGTSPEGLWYGVNGNAYGTRTNWTVAAGYPVVLNTTSPQYITPTSRRSLLYWTDTLDVLDHTYTMTPGDWNITALFYLEHEVDFDTTPSSLTLDIGGNPYTTPVILWLWDGVTYDLNATSPQVVAPGQRYIFAQWSNLGPQNQSYLVSGPDSLLATYVYEVEITIDTAPSGGPVTVDGLQYTTPAAFWWRPTDGHTLDAPPYLVLSPDTRLAYTTWSDNPGIAHVYTVAGFPETVTATYGTTEYLVNLDTSPAGLAFTADGVPYSSPQSLWYASGSMPWFNTSTPQAGSPGTQYVFVDWSDASTLTSRQDTIVAGMNLTANFLTQYQVTVDTQPAGLDFQVDGASWYAAPQTFWWDALSVHTLSVNSSQMGLNFAKWLPDNAPTSSRSWTVTGPDTVIANYTAAAVPLTFTASGTPTSGLAALTVAFNLTASGGNGNYQFSWDFADATMSIQEDPAHIFSAPGVYNVTVSVSDTGGNTTTPQVIQITVFAVPPVLDACSVTPSSASVVISGTQLFVAHGYNGSTELSPITTVWSVTGGIGSITSGGLFTAGATAGSGTVSVDITYGPDTVTCAVPVVVSLTPPPTVAISTPLNGEIVVVPSVVVIGTSTNAVSVQLRVQNGTWQTASGTVAWTITLDLSAFTNTNLRIEAIARGTSTNSTIDDVTVALNVPPNTPPVADAGPDQSGNLKRLVVTLDGSGSSDADLDTLMFSWVQQGGPTVTLTGAGTVGPSFTPTLSGTYQFRLTVDDGTATDTDIVVITVTNRAPVIAGTSPSSVTVSAFKGATQSFVVTVTDADGDPITYTWTINSAPQTGASNLSFDYLATAVGTFIINVTVSDGDGAPVSNSWTLTVTEGRGQAPFPLLPILLLLAIIVAAIVLLLFLMKRRKKPVEEMSPGAVPGQWTEPTQPTTMPTEQTAQPQEWGSPAPAAPAVAPAAVPAAAPAAPSAQDPMVQLARLRELKDQGLISDPEYEAKRKQLLEKL